MKTINKYTNLISAVLFIMIFCIHLEAEDIGHIKMARTYTDAELENLESRLKSDQMYQWELLTVDRKKTIPLILAAQKKSPSNPIWYSLIEMCFASDRHKAKRLPVKMRQSYYAYALQYLEKSRQTLQTAKIADADRKDFDLLSESLKMNTALAFLESRELSSAKELAEEILINNVDPDSWNYGNVIHNANTILGRIALQKNDLKKAKEHLLKSADTTGSPQLNSFGPSFILARELLERKEKSVVLKYLNLVGKFWATPVNINSTNKNSSRVVQEHTQKLIKWKNEIIEGNIPQEENWF